MRLDPNLLHQLCESLGVYHGYHDLGGAYIQASDETKLAQLAAMNVSIESNEDIKNALAEQEREKQRHLPASLVIRQHDACAFELQQQVYSSLPWTISLEDGTTIEGALETGATALVIEHVLPKGYHEITLGRGNSVEHCHLIVTPPQTVAVAEITGHTKAWGITAPLYGLRSSRNWGIGDYEDLAVLAECAARAGADFIGINPVHALFPSAPDIYSPYSPSSREFLNIMHIAPDLIEEFQSCAAAEKLLSTFRSDPVYRTVRTSELVDYPAVYRLKTRAFEAAFSLFKEQASDKRRQAFQAFLDKKGTALKRHALYNVLFERQRKANPAASGWTDWPPELRSPDTDASAEVDKQEKDRVTYYCYLQWIAHAQLDAAHARAIAAGMRIGLYLDLAVGMVPGGAEAWAEPSAIVHGMSLGAPGDAANPDGQKWHLAPLDPIALKATGYRIFRRTLREAMQSAGLIRIDHILGLNRAFWCPLANEAPGNYLNYPREDMLGVIALESERNRCIVVGEDLGTVPEGFRERLADWGLLGCAILYFEREYGAFKAPARFEESKLASLNNHDFPTLKGYWEGEDFRWRKTLDIGTADNRLERDRNERLHDRWLMLKRLEEEGLLPDGVSPDAAPAKLSDDLAVAIHTYLARTQSDIIAVQLEDLLGLRDQPNVPGTTTEEPNWRRKLPVEIESVFNCALASRIVAAIREERP
ncbi:4-alpha-glucanotransferase [Kordiimonas aestuarii]|uniref:4-alpha-glucanotransferase n=1 Tax=Kordiimonas aestuarii TaxID=1005925 RepID=UPI0021D2CB6A|nr:4-alpha-glucanotransferase [Kordiimonas aestuarii]